MVSLCGVGKETSKNYTKANVIRIDIWTKKMIGRYPVVGDILKVIEQDHPEIWVNFPFQWRTKETRGFIRLYNSWDIWVNVGNHLYVKEKRKRCNFVIVIPKRNPKGFKIQYSDNESRVYSKKERVCGEGTIDSVLNRIVSGCVSKKGCD